MFSDQSDLYYISKFEDKYRSFSELIHNNAIELEMFYDYQKDEVRWLNENDVINISEDGIIIPNKYKIWLLNELYNHDVLSVPYIPDFNGMITDLHKNQLIEYGSTLLSKPEQDYYNYLFNKSEFENGLDIRNTYMHGTQVNDENQNYRDYLIFLRMIILIVLKINEEFCLLDNKL